MSDRLIFQLGTSNWQRGGEFASGSGIVHESHHHAYNALPGVRAYSMYPSRRQRFRDEDVRVFPLEHGIPFYESVSPVSNCRWHTMSEDEVNAYRRRLTDEVTEWLDEIEANSTDRFRLAIAHHGFMNTVVMRDVIRRRIAAGRGSMPLLSFVHGPELQMYANERRADQPAEFPLRFLPFIQREKIFDYRDPPHAVDVVVSISNEQIEALLGLFPEFPPERVVLSRNGYNQDVFRRLTHPTDFYADRAKVLAGFMTQVPEGSGRQPEPIAPVEGFDAVVVFCGRFLDWKRLDALLHAAASYEQQERRILTLVIGHGPHEAQVELNDLAAQLGLRRTYFLGPRSQEELAVLFNCADVGCFPSYREPFGLVFIECMACGTPVIGVDSGGPRDFVTPNVGGLVPETTDRVVLARSLAAAVDRALDEDWKRTKGAAAEVYAKQNFSVASQISNMLADVDQVITA
jgi:glycosyltransferase involved in cell wall biosynthesis